MHKMDTDEVLFEYELSKENFALQFQPLKEMSSFISTPRMFYLEFTFQNHSIKSEAFFVCANTSQIKEMELIIGQ